MQKRSKRLCLALAVLLSVSMVLVALVPAVEAASYKKGSSGAVVTQIQTKLKSWGYYTGTVDGIYGSGTERAVRAFQQKNGLLQSHAAHVGHRMRVVRKRRHRHPAERIDARAPPAQTALAHHAGHQFARRLADLGDVAP